MDVDVDGHGVRVGGGARGGRAFSQSSVVRPRDSWATASHVRRRKGATNLLSSAPCVKASQEVVLISRPFRIALLVFLLVLGVGVAVLFATDAFPPEAATPREQGQFAGKTVGVIALVSGTVAWFVVRSRTARPRKM